MKRTLFSREHISLTPEPQRSVTCCQTRLIIIHFKKFKTSSSYFQIIGSTSTLEGAVATCLLRFGDEEGKQLLCVCCSKGTLYNKVSLNDISTHGCNDTQNCLVVHRSRIQQEEEEGWIQQLSGHY